ncbi:MAG: hypothetical protein ASARMPRED_000362 [Alectoria sarmentosa]|nr:MAG: hypothetical protein ASARMPRED_000362 [Alectoria sarmentosa]
MATTAMNYAFKPHGLRVSSVSIPTKPKYISSQRPPPEVHSSLPDGAANQNERSRKVVISRFLLVDGNISFAVGTQIDGVITPDVEEVPVVKILDHVSSAELERYENRDFFDEDERERLLPPQKPRGRPRKDDTIVPSFNMAPIGEETSREQSLLSGEPISIKKTGRPRGSYGKKRGKFTSTAPIIQSTVRRGRPIGSLRRGPYKKADTFTSTKPSIPSNPSATIKKPRGRPRLQKKFSVVIPSFNGPQPQEPDSTPAQESESDVTLHHPKPQYSMIAASGLGQSDSEEVTSRDQSIELLPSSKKRRFNTSNAFVDLSHDDDDDQISPLPSKKAKTLPETSPDPIADDSAALLRQFQARVYGPDHSTKSNIIPHRRSKPSPTLDDSTTLLGQFHAHTHPARSDSSSSDSLMKPAPRPLKPVPTYFSPPKTLPAEAPIRRQSQPKDKPAAIPTSYLNNNITISHLPQRQPSKSTSEISTSPSKSLQRKFSLTPHFPPSTSFRHRSLEGSAESRSYSSSRPPPSQPTNTAFSQSTKTTPVPPKNGKPSPSPRSAPTQSSRTSSTSKIGFAGIPRATDITDYFAPKTAISKTALTKTPHSPTMQLLDPEDTESEDQLAREPSTDSIGSEIIIVRQNRITPSNQIATPQHPFNDPDRSEDEVSEDESPEDDDSLEDESEDDSEEKTRVSAPIQSPTTPQKAQSSVEALNKAFEIEDDDEEEESDSDSDSDSDSSEVMIIKAS